MQVLNFQDVIGKGSVIAEFDLYCPCVHIPLQDGTFLQMDLTFKHMKLMRTKKGHLFIGFPSKAEKLDGGKFQFIPHIDIGMRSREDFQDKVKKLLIESHMIQA